jgi:hypothetical protein
MPMVAVAKINFMTIVPIGTPLFLNLVILHLMD